MTDASLSSAQILGAAKRAGSAEQTPIRGEPVVVTVIADVVAGKTGSRPSSAFGAWWRPLLLPWLLPLGLLAVWQSLSATGYGLSITIDSDPSYLAF